MKASKRILSLVLAVAMIATCGLTTVFAEVNPAATNSGGSTDSGEQPSKEYTIAVDANQYGTVVVNPSSKKAAAGVTVAITATPSEGMKLKSMTLYNATIPDNTGAPITLQGNVGTFTMPANNVRVGLEYESDVAQAKKLTLTGLENAATIKYELNGKSWDITPVASKEFNVMGGTAVKLTITAKTGCTLKSATPTGFKFTTEKDGVYAFTMPNSDASIAFTIEKRKVVNIDENDVKSDVPDGTAAGGKAVDNTEAKAAAPTEKATVENAAAGKLSSAGLQENTKAPIFGAIDVYPVDADGDALTGKLNKPITITIDLGDLGDFVPTLANMRILHLHNGVVKVIKLSSVSGTKISFPMSEFSVVMPIAVEAKGSSGGTSGSTSGGGSYGGGSSTYREFDGEKLYLVGGEIVPASVVEEMAGKDKTFTVVYNGKTYTFNGKNIAKPSKHIMYYTPEEFMKLINAKAVGATVSNISNPDTGANDFVGLALALAVVSLAGVATCSFSKKK